MKKKPRQDDAGLFDASPFPDRVAELEAAIEQANATIETLNGRLRDVTRKQLLAAEIDEMREELAATLRALDEARDEKDVLEADLRKTRDALLATHAALAEVQGSKAYQAISWVTARRGAVKKKLEPFAAATKRRPSLGRGHERPAAIPAAVEQHVDGRRVIAITVTKDDPAWADARAAHALGAVFESRGWRAIYLEQDADAWYGATGRVDVCLVLHDAFDARRAPEGSYRVAWLRERVDRWTARPWFDVFDVVCAASGPAVAAVQHASEHLAYRLPPSVEGPVLADGIEEPELDYIVVGHNTGDAGSVIARLETRDGERFALYGRGWDRERRLAKRAREPRGDERPSDVLRSAKIVVDDATPEGLALGVADQHLLDALAAGVLVVTNNIVAAEEIFDGAMPVYRTAAELRELLDRFLGDYGLRAKVADELRSILLERHTYAQRADVLEQVLESHPRIPSARVRAPAAGIAEAQSSEEARAAHVMARALRDAGFRAHVDPAPAWDEGDGAVVVAVRGSRVYAPRAGSHNVLWILRDPDEVGVEECDLFDEIFVTSEARAEQLRRFVRPPVAVLDPHAPPETLREVAARLRANV